MHIEFGGLHRTEPISRHFGYDRGLPVDRHYIEQFLGRYREDITGRALEIGDDSYTRQFGGDRVTMRDILHIHEGNPKATIISDLSSGEGIPSDAFDCAIITQTLHLIFEPVKALRTLHRILKPGGVLLATVPGITPLSVDEWSTTWYWSFTSASVRRMCASVFGEKGVQVTAYGNVFAAMCFLEGIAVEDVTTAELDVRDPSYDVLITIHAQKFRDT
jgi:SAM-dependent methyltransferase